MAGKKAAPLALFAASLVLAAFAGGVWVAHHRMFPFREMHTAKRTLFTLLDEPDRMIPFLRGIPGPDRWELTAFPRGRVDAHRIRFIDGAPLADPVLFPGGRGKFAEHCPGHAGCIAVEYAGRGEVRHAWPYRPEELARAARSGDPGATWLSFADDVYAFALSQYPNGDLLVVFDATSSLTAVDNVGVARLDRAGRPVWYRRDHSHHRPHLMTGGDALVPGMRVGAGPITVAPRRRQELSFSLKCRRPQLDTVRVIDGDGEILEEISVFDAILASPYARLMRHRDHCDPLHLNSVHVLGEDAGEDEDLVPGDLVVSLRNLDAFAMLGRRTHRLKRLVRGSFAWQHAVLHLEGSRFLMLDNQGGVWGNGRGSSRLLMVDVANGEETTIFPNDATPGDLRSFFYTWIRGDVSLSPDRRRAIVTISGSGRAFEVRLSDGALLTLFHDVHAHDGSHRNAWRGQLPGVSYSGPANGA